MRWIAPIGGLLLLLPVPSAADNPAADSAGIEFFEKKVRPVLVEHCYKCHSAEAKKPKGGLFVDSRAALLKGGDNGAALVPGQAEKSRLVEAITYKNVDLRMPPKGKLPDAVIADLSAWVKMGAPWPKETPKAKVAAAKEEFDIARRKQAHWCWQPIRPAPAPAVKNTNWPRNDIDRFILAKLEEKNIAPAPQADRRTLLRRVYFDLIGLPPPPAEVESALNDKSANWYDKVVDRLLENPQFGERWARHWLDLVRYAESRGHEFDYLAPNAWQYRDYVIRAFNADLPYNQFVIEQVAGDLLDKPRMHPPPSPSPNLGEGKGGSFNESIIGTGFWFLGEQVHSPVDIRQDESDRFDNMVDVLSKTFLGLTVSCARCHDHKFDAISTRDYYALYGFLQSSGYRLARFDTMDHNRRIAGELWSLRARSRAPIQEALAEAMTPTVERLSEYLLATRDVVLGKKIDAVAQERKVREAVLAEWVKQVQQADKDAGDPLHAWARVALDRSAQDSKRFAELLRPIVDEAKKRADAAEAALKGVEVMVDYSRIGPGNWLPDGDTFGHAPVRPGDVRFSNDPTRPIARIIDYAAAEKDSVWDKLKLAPGTENDPGALGTVVRAGRTVRTPTFPLSTGRLHYLVKGSGRIYAAVDSHAMINGPLHGAVMQTFKTGDQFQWFSHDLSRYQGHRIHVEFSALDGAECAIAMIAQTPGAAPQSIPQAHGWQPVGPDVTSLESLAKSYQKEFQAIVVALAADKVLGNASQARLANWLVQHPALLGGDGKQVAELAGPLLAEQARLIAQIKSESRLAMALMDGSGEDEYVFIRGAHKAPGPVVPRRFLEALAGPEKLGGSRGSGRLELARQMTDPTVNPFITRVMVNRLWHHLFGRGIVGSVDNFGVLGEAPTHRELLDHLADRFVREGWSVKKMIRTMMLSNAYRMSSQAEDKADQADVQNLFLHRMRIRRLEGEAIRDAMLQVSGRLNPTMYGAPVPVHLTSFMEGRGRPGSGPLDGEGRRSLYIAIRRNFLAPMMLAFDTPIPFSTVGRRTVSNVPAQSLILMNDPFVQEQAKLWAKKVLAQPGSTRDRLTVMYQSAYTRPPSEQELTACREFLDRQAKLYGGNSDDVAAWTDLAHVLFNAKELIFVN